MSRSSFFGKHAPRKATRARFVPAIESLEERIALNSAPVANPDLYHVYNAQALMVPSQGGLLANDTGSGEGPLSVTAVNGVPANVGQPVTLASGATVTVGDDGSFDYVPHGTFVGDDSYSYTISDGTDADTSSVTLSVASATLTFPQLAAQDNVEGDTVTVAVPASDDAGHPLTFSATGLPDGLSISSTTGAITGSIPPDSTTPGGPLRTVVTVTDGTNSASQAFAWAVDSRISVTAIADQMNSEGDTVSLSSTASIPGGAALTYDATGLPDGLTIDPNMGLISGTIAPGAAKAAGPYVSSVTATDGTYTASTTFQWTINSHVSVTAIPDQESAEGASVSLQATASVPDGGTLSYSADGLPAGLRIDPVTGQISGTVGPNPDLHDAPALVTVSATDGVYTGSTSFSWAIDPRVTVASIDDQQSNEGDTVSLAVSASSPDGTVTTMATGLPPGLFLDSMTGTISGTISPGAALDSPYDVTVTAFAGMYSSSRQFEWDVAPRVTITPIDDRTDVEGATVSLQVSASAPVGEGLTYSAILPMGLSIDPTSGLISGTLPVGSASGPTQVSVTVSDGPYTADIQFSWTITTRLSVADIPDQTSTEGDSVSLQASADVPGGGTLTYGAIGLPMGLSIDPTTGLISGTVGSGAASPWFLVTVTASDGTSVGSTWFLWAVNPRVSLDRVSDQTSVEGQSVSLPVQASVPDGEALRYDAMGLPAGLSIDPSTGQISGTLASGTATQAYDVTVSASSGMYFATQTIRWTVESVVVSGGLTARTDLYTAEPGHPLLAGGPDGLPGLLANDTTTGGGPLAVTEVNGVPVGQDVTLASGSTLTVDADGSFSYVPGPGAFGVESFNVTVTDGVNSAVVPAFINLLFVPIPQFTDAVSELFRALKTDKLTSANTDAAIDTRADLTPSEAAALITIKINFSAGAPAAKLLGFNLTTGITEKQLATLVAYRDATPAAVAADAKSEKPKGLAKLQATAKALESEWDDRVTTAGRIKDLQSDKRVSVDQLIWGKDPTSDTLWKSVQQGNLGDCAFMASLINYAKTTDLATLKGRIKPGAKPGEYKVSLYTVPRPGAKVTEKLYTILQPTLAQRLLYGGTTNNAMWVSLMEMAYLRVRSEEEGRIFAFDRGIPRSLSWGTYYELADTGTGEHPERAMRSLTGKLGDFKAMTALTRKDLEDAFSSYLTRPRMITVSTPNQATLDKIPGAKKLGLMGPHAYAVIAYDPRAGTVKLRNPHNVPDRVGGQDIDVDLATFMRCFVAVTIDGWVRK